jgi:hypothetical protein
VFFSLGQGREAAYNSRPTQKGKSMHLLALILKYLGVAEVVAQDILQLVGSHTNNTVPPTAIAITKSATAGK